MTLATGTTLHNRYRIVNLVLFYTNVADNEGDV